MVKLIAIKPDKNTAGNISVFFPHLRETVNIEKPKAETTPAMPPFKELEPTLSKTIIEIPANASNIAMTV